MEFRKVYKLVEIEFDQIKKGDIICLIEDNNIFVRDIEGNNIFIATSNSKQMEDKINWSFENDTEQNFKIN